MKTTKYHFKTSNKEVITIDSNEVSMKNSTIKFRNNLYLVENTYQEIYDDGNSMYHHECILK